MNINIREASVHDSYAIADIIKDSMGYDNPVSLIEENLKRILELETDKVFIALCDDEIVGFIHAENYDCLYSPPLKELMSFAVKTQYQNKGIGTCLLSEAEKWAKESGRKGIRIISSATRTNAHNYYMKKGYCLEKHEVNLIKYFNC